MHSGFLMQWRVLSQQLTVHTQVVKIGLHATTECGCTLCQQYGEPSGVNVQLAKWCSTKIINVY